MWCHLPALFACQTCQVQSSLQVTFAAVSPRQYSPAAPTPHHSHGFLQRGFNDGYDLSASMNMQQDNGSNQHSPDRSVSFKVVCGRNVRHHFIPVLALPCSDASCYSAPVLTTAAHFMSNAHQVPQVTQDAPRIVLLLFESLHVSVHCRCEQMQYACRSFSQVIHSKALMVLEPCAVLTALQAAPLSLVELPQLVCVCNHAQATTTLPP